MQIEIFALETNKQTKRQKSKSQTKRIKKRDNGLVNLFSKCECVNAFNFVPVCNSAYRMEQNKTLILALSLKNVFLQERMRNCQICTVPIHTARYQMKEITKTHFYIYIYIDIVILVFIIELSE